MLLARLFSGRPRVLISVLAAAAVLVTSFLLVRRAPAAPPARFVAVASSSGRAATSPATTSPAPTSPPGTARPGELTSGPLMSQSPPLRVSIPRLKVDTDLVGLSLHSDGTMEVPDNATTVGWFTGAPTPGSLGPAVLAGHVDWQGKAGSFAHIGTLVAGDTVSVVRLDGSVAVFAVTKVDRYAKNRFPTDAVYGPIDHAGLRLITCGGDFNASTGHYEDNVVVYADLKSAKSP